MVKPHCSKAMPKLDFIPYFNFIYHNSYLLFKITKEVIK